MRIGLPLRTLATATVCVMGPLEEDEASVLAAALEFVLDEASAVIVLVAVDPSSWAIAKAAEPSKRPRNMRMTAR